jgi:CubicO group peptidase (beta-lactamase class C family)
VDIEGSVLPRYQLVLDAFRRNFESGNETGAACCVYVNGEVAVDLWGGLADQASGRRWEGDTPVLLASSTKGLTSICIHLLVQQGVLDLDAPIADYWPEFAAAGKHSISLRWALSHRAGVPAVDRRFDIDDVLAWHPVAAAVAAQKPEWEPGSKHGYHARTFGWIAGEVVRRVSGQTLGGFYAKQIAEPLKLDCWIGLPESVEPRVAAIVPPDPQVQTMLDQFMSTHPLFARVMHQPDNLFAFDNRWNTRPYRAAELPSSNGIGSARALARVYAATVGGVDGIRLLDSATIDAARSEQSAGADAVLRLPTRYGLGFALPATLTPHAPEGAFGHAGGGGSLGFADPANRVAFAYVPNRWVMTDFSRANALVKAMYASLQ